MDSSTLFRIIPIFQISFLYIHDPRPFGFFSLPAILPLYLSPSTMTRDMPAVFSFTEFTFDSLKLLTIEWEVPLTGSDQSVLPAQNS